jgi:branched-chain amino acid aminotransferase
LQSNELAAKKAFMGIKTTKVASSRINEFDESNIQFGKLYADHMLVADYADGAWGTTEIMPYGDIAMSPATTFIHYGQSIFEGIKAYKNKDGRVAIFRPEENWKRFNRSADRMGMPDVPFDIFMEGMKALINLDKAWVPGTEGCSLYIRPYMFATDNFIGVKPAECFRFMIINSPAGAYYNKPTRIYLQDQYVRACKGGVGFAKAAGNYAASMKPMMEAKAKGYDQILWTDGVEHRYIQEIGTMNVFFVVGDKVITPSLNDSILAGITRDSILTLLRDQGKTVEERPITIDEIVEAHQQGLLKEAFGAGTAAVIAPIAALHYKGHDIELPPVESWTLAHSVKADLADIRYGHVADTRNWMYFID